MVKDKLSFNYENQEELVANRYNRQELINGWNQDKLANSSIAIIGSGSLANYTSVALTALGVGNIEIYDNTRINGENNGEFLLKLADAGKNDSKVECLEKILSRINPSVLVKGLHAKIDRPILTELIGRPNLIIDLTNNSESKSILLEYCEAKRLPIILASTNSYKGQAYILKRKPNKNILFKDYNDLEQGFIPSCVIGGMIVEEARKIVMPIDGTDKPVKELFYSSASPIRFSNGIEVDISETSFKDKYISLIGAGALGNFTAIGLALMGVGQIDLVDYDEIESTNLNRQILFYDSVGEKKVKALASKIKQINNNIKVNSIESKLDENFEKHFTKHKPDLIMDCVDNLATRAIANYFAVKYKIPLISGGTDPYSGQVVVYEPNKSACLNCKLNVDKALAKERTSNRCIHAHQPSVIITNEIIAGLMIAEARSVLAPESYGLPVKKTLKYDSTNQKRVGLIGIEQACECKRDEPIKKWIKNITKNGS